MEAIRRRVGESLALVAPWPSRNNVAQLRLAYRRAASWHSNRPMSGNNPRNARCHHLHGKTRRAKFSYQRKATSWYSSNAHARGYGGVSDALLSCRKYQRSETARAKINQRRKSGAHLGDAAGGWQNIMSGMTASMKRPRNGWKIEWHRR